MHLLAVEIGGSKLRLYTGTEDGRVLDRQTVRVDRASGGEGIRAHIREIVDAFAPGSPVRLAGLGEDAVPVGALLLAGTVCP